MKNKDAPDCIKAFESMISNNNIPASLFSDNDSAFLSTSFSSMLDRKRIAFNVNTLNDHHALGIIDSFAKRLKLIISKTMLRNQDKILVSHLQTIITKYNNMKFLVLRRRKEIRDSPNEALHYCTTENRGCIDRANTQGWDRPAMRSTSGTLVHDSETRGCLL